MIRPNLPVSSPVFQRFGNVQTQQSTPNIQTKQAHSEAPKFGAGNNQQAGFWDRCKTAWAVMSQPTKSTKEAVSDLASHVQSEAQKKSAELVDQSLTVQRQDQLSNFISPALSNGIYSGVQDSIDRLDRSNIRDRMSGMLSDIGTSAMNNLARKENQDAVVKVASETGTRAYQKFLEDNRQSTIDTATNIIDGVTRQVDKEQIADAASRTGVKVGTTIWNQGVRGTQRFIVQNYTPLRQMAYGAGLAAGGYYVLPLFTSPTTSNTAMVSGGLLMANGARNLKQSIERLTVNDPAAREKFAEAAKAGDVERLRELIADKVNINGLDKKDATALYRAAEHGQLPALRQLIDVGANLELGWIENRQSPLWIAAQNGHTELVQALIDGGANLEQKNNDGLTPLRVATLMGNREAKNALISAGADISHLDNDEQIYLSARNEIKNPKETLNVSKSDEVHLPITTRSQESPKDLSQIMEKYALDDESDTASSVSEDINLFESDIEDVLDRIVPNYKSPFIDSSPETVQKFSDAICLNKDISHLRADKNVDINGLDYSGYTPLYRAALWGKEDAVKQLIELGVDVNKGCPEHNQTPLDIAEQQSQSEIAQILMKAGAKRAKSLKK